MAAEPRVLVEGAGKVYPDGLEAVAPLDLEFAGGSTTALVGPSGCGKSTLLRMIAGLEDPTSGSITIDGDSPHAVAERGELAVAFQDPSLLPWRSVRQNAALALTLTRRDVNEAAIDATRALALPRFRAGRQVPPPLQRMESENLLAAVFPDQLACLENIAGDRVVPDHPLVRQTLEDCLTEAGFGGKRPRYAGRAASASPATGLAKRHAAEQAALIADALGHSSRTTATAQAS